MRPPTRHSAFFSSLRQVEKRLKIERVNCSSVDDPSQNLSPVVAASSQDDSGSVIQLDILQPSIVSTSQNSGPPEQFLSQPLGFSLTAEEQGLSRASEQSPVIENFNDDGDEIDQLMDLLSLLDTEEERNRKSDDLGRTCDDVFYSKIAQVKGPKCEEELRRLDGWIGHLLGDGGEKTEPLRLAYLLLGKASRLHEEDLGRIEFPVTVEEFLENDPP